MREQTPDLKTFGRVDAALLHGTSFESPIFKTVLGLWIQTNPTAEQRTKCLSCHVPAVTVFPQHVDKINKQVLAGKVHVEGIGCASCHMINGVARYGGAAADLQSNPDSTIYGRMPTRKRTWCIRPRNRRCSKEPTTARPVISIR